VLFAPSDTGLIFRGKFKTSVRRRFPPCYDSSYCCFYLSHYEHLLIVKESLICVYEGSWRNCTYSFEPLFIFPFDGRIQPHLSSLKRMQIIPPSAYYISPLPEKVLRRDSTLTKDYGSSLELCPSFSAHEHHCSTFSPCLRLDSYTMKVMPKSAT
jgi:hypothetical protein